MAGGQKIQHENCWVIVVQELTDQPDARNRIVEYSFFSISPNISYLTIHGSCYSCETCVNNRTGKIPCACVAKPINYFRITRFNQKLCRSVINDPEND